MAVAAEGGGGAGEHLAWKSVEMFKSNTPFKNHSIAGEAPKDE